MHKKQRQEAKAVVARLAITLKKLDLGASRPEILADLAAAERYISDVKHATDMRCNELAVQVQRQAEQIAQDEQAMRAQAEEIRVIRLERDRARQEAWLVEQRLEASRRGPGRRYDTEMIRDFFEQLLWELRALHLEHSRGSDRVVVNPELVDTISHPAKRHGSLLHWTMALDRAPSPDERLKIDRHMASAVQGRIDALEAVVPLIEEATETALVPITADSSGQPMPPTRVYDLDRLLAAIDEATREAD
jgi:hypothetical protein